ncbi:MAG: penicillin-binding transpeptidase domain-containing protein, partial [Bacteroidota bacterium]
LGTSPVTVLEIVGAYGTIANEGVRRDPIFIRRIENASGRLIEDRGGKGRSVMTRRDARTLTAMLQEVVSRGTGARARQYGASGPLAGKTGTTQRNADGRFVLMHPRLVTGAWVGYSDQRVTFGRGSQGYGSRTALPVVASFVGRVLDQLPDVQFRQPPGFGVSMAESRPDSLFGRVDDPAVAEWDWDAYLDGYGEDPADPAAPEAPEIERPETDRPSVDPDPSPGISRINALEDLRDSRDRDDQGGDDHLQERSRTGRVGWDGASGDGGQRRE